MIYVREEISSKPIEPICHKLDKQYFTVGINLKRKRCLLVCNCNQLQSNPHKTLINEYLPCITKKIDSLSTKVDNILLWDDFNSEPNEESMATFCQIHSLKNLINQPICYKNPNNSTYIDLIMRNRCKSFQNSSTFQTRISDFHKITLPVLKVLFKKQKQKVLNYRESIFQEQFLTKLNHVNVSKQGNSLKGFQGKCPIKRKFMRANQAPFKGKELQQAIMIR